MTRQATTPPPGGAKPAPPPAPPRARLSAADPLFAEALGRVFWGRMNSGDAAYRPAPAEVYATLGRNILRDAAHELARLKLEAAGQDSLDLGEGP